MTGPLEDMGPNVCAWGTILTSMGLFFYVWGTTLALSSTPLLCFVLASFASTIFWLLATSFTDPGILPRNPSPRSISELAPPLYRNRTEGGHSVVDTWCSTCRIYRPPRASHCPDCDNCVRDFDHHCPFTRNCIGARNYGYFVCFLLSVSLSLGALIFSCLVLSGQAPPRLGAGGGFLNTALVVFAAALSLVMWGFTAYHLSLVISGLTTKERIKGRKHGASKLRFSERLACCMPSAIEPRRLVPDPRSDASSVPIISERQL